MSSIVSLDKDDRVITIELISGRKIYSAYSDSAYLSIKNSFLNYLKSIQK